MDDKIKSFLEMISAARGCFSHIDVYGRSYMEQPEAVLDEQCDKGLRLLDQLEKSVLELLTDTGKDSQLNGTSDNVVSKEDQAAKDWTFIADGNLPPVRMDILICTRHGQIFEGFLETKDSESLYIDENGKIAFHTYSDGGHWYRYHFRDMLPMSSILAWRYKPFLPSLDGEKLYLTAGEWERITGISLSNMTIKNRGRVINSCCEWEPVKKAEILEDGKIILHLR